MGKIDQMRKDEGGADEAEVRQVWRDLDAGGGGSGTERVKQQKPHQNRQ